MACDDCKKLRADLISVLCNVPTRSHNNTELGIDVVLFRAAGMLRPTDAETKAPTDLHGPYCRRWNLDSMMAQKLFCAKKAGHPEDEGHDFLRVL